MPLRPASERSDPIHKNSMRLSTRYASGDGSCPGRAGEPLARAAV
jgi:hypothetical protein